MDTPKTWRAGRVQIGMSASLTMLYFSYIAACVFATEFMASSSPVGDTLSWSLFIGLLLLLVTVALSVLYLFLSSDEPNKTEIEK